MESEEIGRKSKFRCYGHCPDMIVPFAVCSIGIKRQGGRSPAIQGALLVLVAMVMAANFVVDALHYALDPKLRQ